MSDDLTYSLPAQYPPDLQSASMTLNMILSSDYIILQKGNNVK